MSDFFFYLMLQPILIFTVNSIIILYLPHLKSQKTEMSQKRVHLQSWITQMSNNLC